MIVSVPYIIIFLKSGITKTILTLEDNSSNDTDATSH